MYRHSYKGYTMIQLSKHLYIQTYKHLSRKQGKIFSFYAVIHRHKQNYCSNIYLLLLYIVIPTVSSTLPPAPPSPFLNPKTLSNATPFSNKPLTYTNLNGTALPQQIAHWRKT